MIGDILSKYGVYIFMALLFLAIALMGEHKKVPDTIGKALFVILVIAFVVIFFVRTLE